MRTALLLALAPIVIAPMAYAQAVEPPIQTPPAPGDTPPPAPPETPMPDAPPETPMPPEAPVPSTDPMPEIPAPPPAPPTSPAPVVNYDKPIGPMATPRASGSNTAVSGGTSAAELATQVQSTKDYPICSKTVTDNCVNRSERGKAK